LLRLKGKGNGSFSPKRVIILGGRRATGYCRNWQGDFSYSCEENPEIIDYEAKAGK